MGVFTTVARIWNAQTSQTRFRTRKNSQNSSKCGGFDRIGMSNVFLVRTENKKIKTKQGTTQKKKSRKWNG